MNIFSDIVKGFKWIGKALNTAVVWVPKVVKITEDVSTDADQLMPQATQVLVDVDNLALAAVKDGGAALTKAAALTAAIVTAAQADGINIADDTNVISAFNAFIEEVTTASNWSEVLIAQQKLVTDWDAFGAASEAALKKLETDAASN
jgi:hypothetical protein